MNHDLPDEVDGASGEINIADKFCKVYEELYNPFGSSEAMQAALQSFKLCHLVPQEICGWMD